jgi:type II secretory pathway pseudopilin PulG
MKFSRGYTLVEMLIILVVLMVLAGIVITGYNKFIDNKQLTEAVEGTTSLFQRARERTISSKDNIMYGVHVDNPGGSQLTMFKGNNYSIISKRFSAVPDIYVVPSGVAIDLVNATDIGFYKITGDVALNIPSGTSTAQVTIRFRSSRSGDTKTVTISPTGNITQ